MKLVIATPSPFARKARVALMEKGLAHETIVQNPWQTDIAVNPLGKVPALLLDDGRVIHDSSVIVEYFETLGAPPELIPTDARLRVMHRQIEAIADGICDAVVLIVTERARPREQQSADWLERQARKIPAALRELEQLLGGNKAFTAHGYGLAEIATGCALGYLDLRYPAFDLERRLLASPTKETAMARVPRHQGRADPKIMGSDTSDTISDRPDEPTTDSDGLDQAEEAQLGITDEELRGEESDEKSDRIKRTRPRR